MENVNECLHVCEGVLIDHGSDSIEINLQVVVSCPMHVLRTQP